MYFHGTPTPRFADSRRFGSARRAENGEADTGIRTARRKMTTRVRRMASRTKNAAAKTSYPRLEVLDKLEQKELGILHLIHSGVNCSRLELAGQTNLSP